MHDPSEEEIHNLHQMLFEVVQKIREHPSSWPFHHPVNREEVADYYDVIKDPIGMLS